MRLSSSPNLWCIDSHSSSLGVGSRRHIPECRGDLSGQSIADTQGLSAFQQSPHRPYTYHGSGFFIEIDVETPVEIVNLILNAPLFRVFELPESSVNVKLSRSKESPIYDQYLLQVLCLSYSNVASSWLGALALEAGVYRA